MFFNWAWYSAAVAGSNLAIILFIAESFGLYPGNDTFLNKRPVKKNDFIVIDEELLEDEDLIEVIQVIYGGW